MRTLVYIVIFLGSAFSWAQGDIQVVGSLPQQIFETSGLIYYDGKLITHNDSGNLAQLYELDTVSLEITRTVTIENATNVDWEDIAQDDTYIYVGDIGNNNGDRQNLAVLKIAKQDYDTSDTVAAERIDFFYEDQENFTTSPNSDWDAEALFVLGEDLVILTKQWQAQGTVAYRIPKFPGAFLAERLGSYPVNGLVTGATFDPQSNALYLVGYNQFLAPFFMVFDGVGEQDIFSGEVKKTNLNVGFAQIEALEKVDSLFYATSEQFNNSNPPISSASRLFRFSLDADEVPVEEEEEEPENPPKMANDNDRLLLYKSFESTILNYRLNTNRAIFGMGIFDASGRQVQFVPLEELQNDAIDLSTLGSSVYYFTFFLRGKTLSKPFFKY
ncbi:MAG: secretion protein [Muricauda sp.]|nr:T9SS C-terminal target domain-containing protein [Allomuricauda sp.]MAU25885.1 secretion protein [Allomuricauda sp.]MBC30900.1 secretion protein [Allomuricauda sp.]|tara:strand:+ start:58035 stop:59192 length:1158 start_codon:yes stop_codon:yes gene_type:complete